MEGMEGKYGLGQYETTPRFFREEHPEFPFRPFQTKASA